MESPLLLLYESTVVGEIGDPFIHDPLVPQPTWFGKFRMTLDDRGEPAEGHLREFIAFCIDWHHRLEVEDDVDASEFDRFGELVASNSWKTRSIDGIVMTIDRWPVFYDDEITWGYL